MSESYRKDRDKRDADTRRLNREHYRGMTLVNLLNHAHAALPQVRMVFSDEPGNRRLARGMAASVAAIAYELAARGDHHTAALLRSYRHTARTSRLVTWGQDQAGRAVPVALPPAYDIATGRMRHPRQVARTRGR